METTVWEVTFLKPPKVKHHCKKCGAEREFTSSERFRVNAQGKQLDIWLIYKCDICGNTWNMDVLSRTKPQDISDRLLEAYYGNNKQLALSVATNLSVLQKNKVTPIITPCLYEITGEDISSAYSGKLIIRSTFPIKLATVLKEKLHLTNSELGDLLRSGKLYSTGEKDIKKQKVQGEIEILIRPK